MRGFALKLTKSSVKSDDLVQTTMAKAMAKHHQFQPGTNLKAWLFTMLRNEFLSTLRVRGREVEDPEGAFASSMTTNPDQAHAYDLKLVMARIALLPPQPRLALQLVAIEGFEYGDVAEIMGIAEGTVKSQVHRARTMLRELVGTDYP